MVFGDNALVNQASTSAITSTSTPTQSFSGFNNNATTYPWGVILVSYYTTSSVTSCATPTGTLLGTVTSIAGPPSPASTVSGSTHFGFCAFSARLNTVTGGAGTISERLNLAASGSTYISIQMIELTADSALTFPNSSYNSGTTSTITYNLNPASTGDTEILFGVNNNGGGTPRTFTAPTSPTGYTQIADSGAVGPGGNAFRAAAAIGPANTPLGTAINGTLSGTASWGTYGIDVKP